MALPAELKSNIHKALKEGWDVENIDGALKIIAHGKQFSIRHPFEIHLRLYRDIKDPGIKLASMHRLHDMLWPDHAITWNKWQEDMMACHCGGYKIITYAAGAGAGKSVTAAKIGLIFWISDPLGNAVLVASTTLAALSSRIWGYVGNLFAKAQKNINIAGKYYRSMPPKIMYPGQNDEIHGMFANAIPEGEDEDTIKNVIGRHPDRRLLVILDESSEMNPAIAKGVPNLERGIEFFQLIAIANSNSRYDLHGSLSTPLKGWDKLDPSVDRLWPTTQENGIAYYMHPAESPAITEKDPERKEALSKFLLTEEQFAKAKEKYGEHSDSYYRFTLGFWKKQAIDTVAISQQFLDENEVDRMSEWGGYTPLQILGGLDPAFQLKAADRCILRFAVWGQTLSGKLVLDYRKKELLFDIPVRADLEKSGERQIAEFVCHKCAEFGITPSNVAIDATGVGRALSELIAVVWYELVGVRCEPPYRIISTRPKTVDGKTDPHITVLGASDMWLKYREFIQAGHISGLDPLTIEQMKSRQIKEKHGKLILETKQEYKDRMNAINPVLARSPDESDAAILVLIAAILRFGFAPGAHRPVPSAVDRFANEKMMAADKILRGDFGNKLPDKGTGSGRPRILPNFSSSLEEGVEFLSSSRSLRRS